MTLTRSFLLKVTAILAVSILCDTVRATWLKDHYIVTLKSEVTSAEAEQHVHTVRALHQETQLSEKYVVYEGVKAHYRKLNMYAIHTTDELIQYLREHHMHQIEHIEPDAVLQRATLEDDIRDDYMDSDPVADEIFKKARVREFEDVSYHYEEPFGPRLYLDLSEKSTALGQLRTTVASFHQARISHRTLAATKAHAPIYNYAYRAPKSIASPVVYVLDSGVVPWHPEFEDRVTYGDASSGKTNPLDKDGHGTSCMSRAIGSVLGTAPNGRGVSVKVQSDETGQTTVSSFLAGMDYVARQPELHYLKVISISIGIQPAPLEHDQEYWWAQRAVDRLDALGIHIVWSAGNENRETLWTDSPKNSEGVLLVGSVNDRDEKSSFSNYGPHVTLAAPATDVLVATIINQKTQGYQFASGTSYAAPQVAGIMLQVLSTYGPMEPWLMRDLLMNWTSVAATGTPPGMPMRILYNNSGL